VTPPPAAGGEVVRRSFVTAIRRGVVAFLIVAGIGQAFALAALVVGARAPFGSYVRLGIVYLGAFHHVAIELDVPELDLAGVSEPGATMLSIGIALLSVTAIASWLLFRAGRAAADRSAASAPQRIAFGAAVAPGYALPAFALMMLAGSTGPVGIGSFASGDLHLSLSTWQAALYPLALAVVSGAAGGLASTLGSDARGGSALVCAAAAGGRRMFVLALGLSLLGLFAAGVVQPDGPAALLTPSTARYWRAVTDRPGEGLVLLGHHLALAPNEALWTLIPAMGGSLGARGSASSDVLAYRRFPTEVQTILVPVGTDQVVRVPLGHATFGPAPPQYLLFLLVPAISTVLGGRLAAERSTGRGAVLAGACSGLVFAGLVGAGSLLSALTVSYGAAFGADATSGRVTVGPLVVAGTALALVWGVAGGALGSWSLRVRSRSS
jgi:hypothetical protein